MKADKRPVFFFRCDGSRYIGHGHVVRSLALAEGLKRLGRCIFVTRAYEPGLLRRIEKRGFGLVSIPPEASLKEDLSLTLKEIAGYKPAVVITDNYKLSERYLVSLKKQGVFLVSLDDLGEKYFPSDIVLNQNVTAGRISYRVGPDTRLLLGPRFALLRKEFSRIRRRRFSPVVRHILLTFGGGDPENQTCKAVQALDEIERDFSVTVITGASYPYQRQLENMAAQAKHRFILRCGVENMASLMSGVDLAVSAGGGTCYELAYFGIPMALLVVADNQRENAAELARHGVAVNLGDYRKVSSITLRNEVKKLIYGSGRRKEMSERGKNLVDGKGVGRIAREIARAIK